jgi:Phage terminase large subunit (GpA)
MSTALAYDAYKRREGQVILTSTGEKELAEEWDYEPEISDEFLTEEEIDKKQAQLIGVAPSQFVEFAIKLPDKELQKHVNFSFKKREYLRLPYDTPSRRTLYKCGRQVEKSTLLGNKTLSYCCIINAFNVLYVSPTNQQTKTFSADRLKEPIETSEILKAWTTSKLSDNVFLKKFINRSQVTLRYAYHNADRTRGIPADLVLLDEIQDIITDNIPVIEECASHSHYKIFIYSGTPKSYDNAIEHYWTNYSTQNEWVVPCDRHGTPNDASSWHWNVLGEAHVKPQGLCCDRCGERIDPRHPMAQWATMNPSVKNKLKDWYEGYRIPQLMVPWLNWGEIYDKYIKYPRSQFYNEVLGMSYDSGTRPLTRQDVMDNCNPAMAMDEHSLVALKGALGVTSPVYAGIDWGTGEGSYSVMSLGAYMHGFFQIFYIHRFEGQEIEPPMQLGLIEQLIRYWDVKLVGCDYGGGFDRNDSLSRTFGRQRIVKYQYSQPGQKVKWEEGLNRFLVHRTEVMSDIFNAIKRRDVLRFPRWEQFEDPFAKDMLSIFSEYNEVQRQVQYKHAPDATDDSFHSILLCFLASMIRHPRYDVMNPTQKTGYAAQDDG